FLRVHRSVERDEWEVRTKAGVTLRFGGKGFTEAEGPHVASYLLREQIDLRGNRIRYEWTTEDGYALLSRIVWNEFSDDSRNEAVLRYETRPDPSTLFAHGIRQHLKRRLSQL